MTPVQDPLDHLGSLLVVVPPGLDDPRVRAASAFLESCREHRKNGAPLTFFIQDLCAHLDDLFTLLGALGILDTGTDDAMLFLTQKKLSGVLFPRPADPFADKPMQPSKMYMNQADWDDIVQFSKECV